MSSERQEINTVSPWWGEHIHRYNEVLKHLTGNEIVLDIACGSGFGTHLLSENTKNIVIGGDLSEEAINLCNSNWSNKNLFFQLIDGTQLPFQDNYFDVIVSFETIEHTTKFDLMLNELKRVLKPNGKLFLSTPNRIVNSPKGIITNPFHTQEWIYSELNNILKKHFINYKIFGQHYCRYDKSKGLTFYVEKILYARGIRKLPIKLQDRIMKFFGKQQLYPLADDFIFVENIDVIEKCKTFYAICRK